jgi:T5SS/PEP-CTERM-associated repeat protein
MSIINGGRANTVLGRIGLGGPGQGTVTVSGVESTWNNTQQITVGENGSGSLSVSAGGRVSTGTAIVGDNSHRGTVNINGFSSSMQVTGRLTVGDGRSGSATVQSGGSLSSGSADVGALASGSGDVTITGPNSIWDNNGVLTIGALGTGSVSIADRGTLVSSRVSVSDGAGSFGSLTVTGAGSEARLTQALSIARGTTSVVAGALVRAANAEVGVPVGGVGTLVVADPGSRLALTSTFDVGVEGHGVVRISDGGAVSTGAVMLADQAGSAGTALVSSAGSTWQIAGNLNVGNLGTGNLTISDGGFASATLDANIGALAGSNGSLTVTGAGSRVAAERLIVGGTFLTVGGTGLLAIGPGGTAAATTSAKVYFGSRLTLDQGVVSTGSIDNRGLLINSDGLIAANSFSNLGTLRMAGTSARITSSMGNSGLLTGAGEIAGTLFNSTGGEIRLSAGEHLRFFASSNTNQGRINLLGGTLEFANSLGNIEPGIISGHGTLIFANSLSNGGKMQFSGGATDIYGNVTFTGGTGGGEMINSGSGNVVTYYGNVAHLGDEIRTSPTNTTVFFGNVTGNGPFTGTGAVRFEGAVSPGNSPGIMPAEGDLHFGADSRLLMELAGTSPGSQYDQLHVGGVLSLDGALDVTLLDDFTPRYGDTFDLLDFAALAGRFDTVNLPALKAGLLWDTSALYSTGTIAAVPEPAGWLLVCVGVAAAAVTIRIRRRPS